MGSRAETRTWVGQRKAETPVWTDTEMPSSRFTWTRPTTHIYSYNREAQNIISSRSARATSVAANESRSAMTSTSESTMRSSRAASVAATSDNFSGYSGYYGRQLAQIMQKQGPTAAAAAVPIRESLRAGSPAPTIYPNRRLQVQVEAPALPRQRRLRAPLLSRPRRPPLLSQRSPASRF